MKILITTLGSTGDILPFVSLATMLRAAGHSIKFVVPESISSYAIDADFDVICLGENNQSLYMEFQKKLSENQLTDEDLASRQLEMSAQANMAIKTLRGEAKKADLMIRLYGMPFAPLVAKLTRTPEVILRLAYPDHEALADNVGQKALTQVHAHQPDALRDDQLCLYAFSPLLLGDTSSWPDNNRVVGFIFPQHEVQENLASVLKFPNSDKPVIGVTLGSTVHNKPQEMFELLCHSIRQAGCNGIIQRGWSGIGCDDYHTEDIRVISYMPHAELFPYLDCVVHHAGAGTTAASMRYGLPVVCIPHYSDQFRISKELQKLGLVNHIIPYADLSAARLGSALADTVGSRELKANASSISQQVQMQSGVEQAVDCIELFASQHLGSVRTSA